MSHSAILHARGDFPILQQPHHADTPLVYLDNGATSQKPQAVITAMDDLYLRYNANVHRGLHKLSEEASAAYEGVRKSVAKFINAASWREVIFTSGATASINLVAQTWGRANLKAGDVVLSTVMEHHANIVPWQMLAAERGFTVKFIPVLADGTLDMDYAREALAGGQVRLLAVTHVSNVLGTHNPIATLAQMAHAASALILVDGAQAVSHLTVDVQALDVDFYAFSSHKMYGPTGIGVLYGKRAILNDMPPFMGGGDMIEKVTVNGSTFATPPLRFEAGTPPIAEAIGLGAALEYINTIGMENIHAHIETLVDYALERIERLPHVKIYGHAPERAGVVAFTVDNVHAHDVAQILDTQGIAVRAGHHCAMPLHHALGVPATARASFALYTTTAEIDALVSALEALKDV